MEEPEAEGLMKNWEASPDQVVWQIYDSQAPWSTQPQTLLWAGAAPCQRLEQRAGQAPPRSPEQEPHCVHTLNLYPTLQASPGSKEATHGDGYETLWEGESKRRRLR